MMTRCYNPKAIEFGRYGGRGIRVCERWHNFENFLADMGNPPTPEHSIDRINVDDHYSPENCRWATPKEQSRNRRSNHYLTVNGETKLLVDWAEISGLPMYLICKRLKRGRTPEEAVLTPRGKRRQA